MSTAVNTGHVLLVEDEPLIAVTLTDDLAAAGYGVRHTADGTEALRLLAQDRFDAVVTDLRLPGASGVEVARAASRSRTSVLVITAHAAGRGDDLHQLGAAVLQKPFANRVVLDWLRAAPVLS
ncbi:MAG: response regulator [Planctomycetes bacterium]|nr:response regulator [Planctomycetota bacterium]